jgi:hypothetical protein
MGDGGKPQKRDIGGRPQSGTHEIDRVWFRIRQPTGRSAESVKGEHFGDHDHTDASRVTHKAFIYFGGSTVPS